MPGRRREYMPREEILSFEEIGAFRTGSGFPRRENKLRLTGGEPRFEKICRC